MYQNDRLLANYKISKKIEWVITRTGTLDLNQQQETCIQVAGMSYYVDQSIMSVLTRESMTVPEVRYEYYMKPSLHHNRQQERCTELVYTGYLHYTVWPITVAARSMTGSDAELVGSNPTQNMGLYCMRFFCVCAVLCVSRGLETSWSPV
jgi:hypothetical protein